MQITDTKDYQILARIGYGEASGEPILGLAGVMWSVKNRANWKPSGQWWGSTIMEAATKANQYDCLSQAFGGPDYIRTVHFNPDATDPESIIIRGIAQGVVDGTIPDPSHGATSYFNPKGVSKWPTWATKDRFTVQLGQHLFYKVAPQG